MQEPKWRRGNDQGLSLEVRFLHPCLLLSLLSSLMLPVVWHSCICCANMEQNALGAEGGEVLQLVAVEKS